MNGESSLIVITWVKPMQEVALTGFEGGLAFGSHGHGSGVCHDGGKVSP